VIEVGMISEILSPRTLSSESIGFRTFRSPTRFVSPPRFCRYRVWHGAPAEASDSPWRQGFSVVNASSDLDLVLTLDDVPPLAMLADLREAFRSCPRVSTASSICQSEASHSTNFSARADRVLVAHRRWPVTDQSGPVDVMIAFLYPGQGAQHAGLLRALPGSAATRRTLEEAAELLRLSTSSTPQKRWRRPRMLNWRC